MHLCPVANILRRLGYTCTRYRTNTTKTRRWLSLWVCNVSFERAATLPSDTKQLTMEPPVPVFMTRLYCNRKFKKIASGANYLLSYFHDKTKRQKCKTKNKSLRLSKTKKFMKIQTETFTCKAHSIIFDSDLSVFQNHSSIYRGIIH